tara:strand:- start:155 stop:481 length:327 start_codon:yes stop_codon:yes gene_type:complete
MKKYFRVRFVDEFGCPETQQDRIDTHKEAMEVVKECEILFDMDCWLEEYEEQPPKEERVYAYPNSVDGWEDIYTHEEQCYYDRCDHVQERLERGEIDEENASELRMGA